MRITYWLAGVAGLALASMASPGMARVVAKQMTPPTPPTQMRWDTGTMTISEFDCAASGVQLLLIDGIVDLRHPILDGEGPPVITITCPLMRFAAKSEIRVNAPLKIKIFEEASGPIRIINTNGEKGIDAPQTPEIWEARAARSGNDAGGGGNGRDAETNLRGNWSAERGGDGGNGENGEHGAYGSSGASGSVGTKGGNISLRVADVAPGTSIYLRADGGEGGRGGKGGRGVDGGKGGNGGPGGEGGDGNAIHDGKSGGNGGNGGDGGNGGNGGTGGNGGHGGAGGNVYFYWLQGARPAFDIDLLSDGGDGGIPGEGGDPGLGGKGGTRANAGCGGDRGGFGTVIQTTSGGSCGTDGHPGVDGNDGKKGPPGVFGQEGPPGPHGIISMGAIKPIDF